MSVFDDRLYEALREGTRSSARVVAPRLLDELQRPRGVAVPSTPYEVLDVGCGEGWWSAALAADPRVYDVVSIDQVVPSTVAPGVTVQPLDLERSWDRVAEGFDLVVCLEVAEHLSDTAGLNLVASLCRAAKPNGVIAFSAAVPGQGGNGHVNEQWPSYWDERFRAHGWMLYDPLREALWTDDRVEPWYTQNLLCAMTPSGNGTSWASGSAPRSLVHPAIWGMRLRDIAHWRDEYSVIVNRLAAEALDS